MLQFLILAAALFIPGQLPSAQAQPKTWTQVGMLTCKLNPSIGFVIFGHQTIGMSIRSESAITAATL